MISSPRRTGLARLALALTIVFAVLALLALLVPMWIESTTAFDPDGGSGELEAFLAIPFGVAAVVCGVLTWRRRASTARARRSTGAD